jgi:amino acid transporter
MTPTLKTSPETGESSSGGLPGVAPPSKGSLRRVLTLPSLVAAAVGTVVSQSAMVTLLQGTGMGGYAVFIALLCAFILSLTYIFSFAELALMLPSAGSLSSYTTVAIGHFPAVVAVYAGYVIPAMFGLPAELLLIGNIGKQLLPGGVPPTGIAWSLLVLFSILNILGVDIFARLQNLLTVVKVIVLFAIGAGACVIAWFYLPAVPITAALVPASSVPASSANFLGLVTLVMTAFLGVELICPLIEETRSPEKNLPRAMLISSLIIAVLSGIFCLGAILTMPTLQRLVESNAPHLDYTMRVFAKAGTVVFVVAIVSATCGVLNGVLAMVPRILYGMACNGQTFAVLKTIHPRFGTPWVAIVFMTCLAGLPLLVLHSQANVLTILLISTSTSWLLAYIIAHVDVIVLRHRFPDARRPFKTPLYPVPQILGIGGMAYALVYNSPTPELARAVLGTAGLVIAIVCIGSALWVKLVMRRKLFEPDFVGQESELLPNTRAPAVLSGTA